VKTIAIVGSQWGDEGKGKITDLLAQKSDLVVRFQGGNNAGHTIIVGDQKIILHLIPSGILHPTCLSLIGHGVVLEPEALITELAEIKSAGVQISPENFRISSSCSIITSYHRIMDSVRETKGPIKIGTTGKGIGPAYEDKVSRKGIKVSDLFDRDTLQSKLEKNIIEKKVLLDHLYETPYPSVSEEVSRLYELGQQIKDYVCDSFSLIDYHTTRGSHILYEGAQGVLLDIDYGSYPYVTSSSTSYGGIFTGAGAPKGKVDEVIGITKAYTTRVGEGPFPTELNTPIGEKIQQIGGEFGATTGRKRRCGWLDLPLLKYSIKASCITSIALTKLDVLSEIEELKVCRAYKYEGKEIDIAYPGIDLSKVEPIFETFTPFTDTFENDDLSNELERYIKLIEESCEVPVGIIAFGPERNQIQLTKEFF
jgi:adenylosuccinate synthase